MIIIQVACVVCVISITCWLHSHVHN